MWFNQIVAFWDIEMLAAWRGQQSKERHVWNCLKPINNQHQSFSLQSKNCVCFARLISLRLNVTGNRFCVWKLRRGKRSNFENFKWTALSLGIFIVNLQSEGLNQVKFLYLYTRCEVRLCGLRALGTFETPIKCIEYRLNQLLLKIA